MNEQERLKKLYFNVKLSGWLGLIPTIAAWRLYQETGLFEFIFAAVFAIGISFYIFITSDRDSWQNRNKMTRMIILSIFFAGLFPSIPLFFALKYTNRDN